MKLELRAIRRSEVGRVELPAGFGLLVVDRLAALVEVAAEGADLRDRERLRRYQKALDLCWQEGAITLLPVRAGAIFSHPSEIARLLQERAAEFERDLTRLEGKVELGLRLALINKAESAPPNPPAPSGQSRGLAYMQQLVQRQTQEQNHLKKVEAIIEELATLALEQSYLPPAPNATFAEVAFLLKREDVVSFKTQLQHCALPAIIIGPTPPFSFV
ncbi:MAG: GvpL/GvpF family gas vesicle protein [Chloroflexota bacterium]|nr:GvpL/GvpF family gas vesicle protein [Chloroflexota bacterium]